MAGRSRKISGHQQRWPRSLPGAIFIPPVLLVVADLLTQGKRTEIVNPIISINTLAYEGYDLTTALQEIARIGAGHVEMGFTRGFTV